MDLVTFPVTTAAVTAPARPSSAADPAPLAPARQADPSATNLRPRPEEPAIRDASRVEEAGKPRALKPYGVIILPDRAPAANDQARRTGGENGQGLSNSPAPVVNHPLTDTVARDVAATDVGAPQDRPPDPTS